MKPVLLALAALTISLPTIAHAQPYDRGDRDRGDRNYNNDWRDHRGDDWRDRWRWRCARDFDWCRRYCWRDYYGQINCRRDDDDRYDWRDYWRQNNRR